MGSGEAGLGIMKQVEEMGWNTTRVIGIRSSRNPHIGGGGMQSGVRKWMERKNRTRRFDYASLDPTITDEEISASVPDGIRSEPAAAVPFAWLAHPHCEHPTDDYCRRSRFPDCFARLVGNRVVVINSGYGKLQEALDAAVAT
jgi:hypothetical protein